MMSVGHGSAWWSSELVVHTAALRMLWFLLPWLRAGRLGSLWRGSVGTEGGVTE